MLLIFSLPLFFSEQKCTLFLTCAHPWNWVITPNMMQLENGLPAGFAGQEGGVVLVGGKIELSL